MATDDKTATYIRNVTGSAVGDMRLYRLNPPIIDPRTKRFHVYVIVSSLPDSSTVGAETLIFPSNEAGRVTSWNELEGSMRGVTDHDTVLARVGYRTLNGPKQMHVIGDPNHTRAQDRKRGDNRAHLRVT